MVLNSFKHFSNQQKVLAFDKKKKDEIISKKDNESIGSHISNIWRNEWHYTGVC